MKKGAFNFLKIALPLLLGVFLIWYSYNKFSPEQLEEIKTHFSKANYGYVILSVVFGILSNLSRAYRWKYTLASLGYKPKFKNNIMAVYIAYLMNLFIPRSGEVSRALVINKYENVPFDKAFGTIISERAADFIILMLIVAAAFALQFQVLTNYLSGEINLSKIYIPVIVLCVLGITVFLAVKKSKSAFAGKIKTFLSGLKEGILSIFKMEQKWAFLFHTLFIWAMYVLMFYVVVFCLPETSAITFGAILTAFVAGGFVIAFTNSGFGSYPFVVANILLLFDVPETAGTAFGWIVWSSQTITTMVLGVLSFLLLPVLNKVKTTPNIR